MPVDWLTYILFGTIVGGVAVGVLMVVLIADRMNAGHGSNGSRHDRSSSDRSDRPASTDRPAGQRRGATARSAEEIVTVAPIEGPGTFDEPTYRLDSPVRADRPTPARPIMQTVRPSLGDADGGTFGSAFGGAGSRFEADFAPVQAVPIRP